jgi:site-specific recombinase XerD
MVYGGVGIKEISGILGHSNLSTTSEIYTHLLDETFVEQLSVMNKYFPK